MKGIEIMTTIITEDGISYKLTTAHPASSYGQPVLVDSDNNAYGQDDVVQVIDPDIFGERTLRTASMIVNHYCKSHMPVEYVVIDPAIRRFAQC